MVGRYTDQDYDSEFIQVLQTQCFKFIKQEGDPTLEDVSTFIHEKVSAMLICFQTLGQPDHPCIAGDKATDAGCRASRVYSFVMRM